MLVGSTSRPLLPFFALAALVLAPASAQTPEALEGLDAEVQQALADLQVPGLALGVVHNGTVILAKGYGHRDVDQELPVTDKTLFAIGSSSKAFTTVLLGMLVDAGELAWDEPARQWLPELRLQDELAGAQITPRDLVTHRSGLPRHDALWYLGAVRRDELLERLPHLEASAGFREKFQYNNLMYATAGILIEQVTGKSWEDNVRERLFGPLGMAHSNLDVLHSERSDDYALPYGARKDDVVRVPFYRITAMGPAGSINSNVTDMCKWLLLHLHDGKVAGQQLIRKNTLSDMHVPHMAISARASDEAPFTAYGLGWMISPYRGRDRSHHGGGIDGFTALVTLLPKDGIGVVALCNRGRTQLPTLVTNHVMDSLLGFERKDWLGEASARVAKAKAAAAEKAEEDEPERVEGTTPSHPLPAYCGGFQHPGYGDVTIAVGGDGSLELHYGRVDARLEHFHYDTFRVVLPQRPELSLRMTFLANADGDVDRIAATLEPAVKPIEFERKPAAPSAEMLEKLVGKYRLTAAPRTLTLELRGDGTLLLTVPDQPTYELRPSRALDFEIKGLTGYKVRFQADANGAVDALRLIQPNGTFEARRVK